MFIISSTNENRAFLSIHYSIKLLKLITICKTVFTEQFIIDTYP